MNYYTGYGLRVYNGGEFLHLDFPDYNTQEYRFAFEIDNANRWPSAWGQITIEGTLIGAVPYAKYFDRVIGISRFHNMVPFRNYVEAKSINVVDNGFVKYAVAIKRNYSLNHTSEYMKVTTDDSAQNRFSFIRSSADPNEYLIRD